VNDDWRLQIDLGEPGHAGPLAENLEAHEPEHGLSDAFHDRVVVSRDGDRVFLYAGSRKQAEAARKLVLGLAERHGWNLDTDLKRWHPTAEEWEDPDKALPDDDAARLAEHEELIAAERRQTEERGHPELEVRIGLPTHHDAHRFAEQLRSEGLPVVHRWRYVLLGAADEDQAKLELSLHRTFAHAGRRTSFVVAKCPLPRGPVPRNPPGPTFPFLRVTAHYAEQGDMESTKSPVLRRAC
jgi:hypothetical protein